MQARLSLHWLLMLYKFQNFEQALIEIRAYQVADKGHERLAPVLKTILHQCVI